MYYTESMDLTVWKVKMFTRPIYLLDSKQKNYTKTN